MTGLVGLGCKRCLRVECFTSGSWVQCSSDWNNVPISRLFQNKCYIGDLKNDMKVILCNSSDFLLLSKYWYVVYCWWGYFSRPRYVALIWRWGWHLPNTYMAYNILKTTFVAQSLSLFNWNWFKSVNENMDCFRFVCRFVSICLQHGHFNLLHVCALGLVAMTW